MVITTNANALYLPFADGVAQCCVTSPPYYGLRDYGCAGQIGLEQTPDEYVSNIVSVMREVWRVLKDNGTAWVNLGDSYASSGLKQTGRQDGGRPQRGFGWAEYDITRSKAGGSGNCKPKDLIGIPWRVAFALQADGWYLRSDIIWSKPNPMPESVTDRPTKAHEYVFLLAKQERYYYDAGAIQEECKTGDKGSSFTSDKTGSRHLTPVGQAPRNDESKRNKRTVWNVSCQPYREAHFATFPPALIRPMVLAGSAPNDIVIDPFSGSGTTALVATELGRRFIGTELNPAYLRLSQKRTTTTIGMF